MFEGIDHVEIAVEDLDQGIEQYEAIFVVDRAGELFSRHRTKLDLDQVLVKQRIVTA